MRTDDSEQCARCAVERTDRACAVRRWLIDHEAQRTATDFCAECKDNFESPQIDVWMDEKDIVGSREIACVSPYTCDRVLRYRVTRLDLPKNHTFS